MKVEHEYRLIPAGKFKATCLQLMEEINQKPLTIIMTKRGKPVAQMTAAPAGMKILAPTVQMPEGDEVLAEVSAVMPEILTKIKKDRKGKRKDKKKHK